MERGYVGDSIRKHVTEFRISWPLRGRNAEAERSRCRFTESRQARELFGSLPERSRSLSARERSGVVHWWFAWGEVDLEVSRCDQDR